MSAKDSKSPNPDTGSPRLRGGGVSMVLGDLEAEIMELLWQQSPASVRDIHERLMARRPIAYTTVMTVMGRLADKGLLAREMRGRAYLYAPTRDRDQFCAETFTRVMKGLWGGFSEPALSHFIDAVGREDAGRLDELTRLIEARRKESTK